VLADNPRLGYLPEIRVVVEQFLGRLGMEVLNLTQGVAGEGVQPVLREIVYFHFGV